MKLEKRYGLLTAIAMVVGIVIGSGVFYKAQTILDLTKGNVLTGILAWVIGGVVMIICALTFSVLATRFSKLNGLVDYSEVTVGKKYSYFLSWFIATIYFPAMTSVLVWVTARYTGQLFGWSLNDANVMTLGVLYLVIIYAINAIAPKLAGKIQISTTVIKLIPLGLMAIIGLIYGLCNTTVKYEVINGEVVATGVNQMQILIENFKNSGNWDIKVLLGAVVSSAFAYEGWIVATSICGELKNPKKNMPIALFIGAIIIMAVYILYYIGVTGGASVDVLMVGGPQYAFLQIFGGFFGTVLNVFIVISCIGTLNGLMVANIRSFYNMGVRNMGCKPQVFKSIDETTNMPTNSSVMGILMVGIWYIYFYGANLAPNSWFGVFKFDSSELPIITMYGMYLPIFILMIKKFHKELGIFKGIILPIIAIIASIFMMFAAVYAHGFALVYYLILFAVVMIIGIIFYIINTKNNIQILDFNDLAEYIDEE